MSLDDPASTQTGLSQQTGDAAVCPGPIVFPMGEGQDATAWEEQMGYPTDAQTGGLSLSTLLSEIRAEDAAGRFMMDVYDEVIAQKGGEGSDEAAAFLTNFMPVNPALGDEREISCRLTYLDTYRVSMGVSGALPSDSGELDGERVDRPLAIVGAGDAMLNGVYEIVVARQRSTTASLGFGQSISNTSSRNPREAAQDVIRGVEMAHTTNAVIGWLIIGCNVALTVMGVGAAVGAVRIAASVGARLAARVVLAFEASEGIETFTRYLGGRSHGYNPLKQAFRWAGQRANGAGGADMAEYIYNTVNITVGFGGKVGLFAGSLYATTQMPSACQPADGNMTEEVLPSQDDTHRTVF